MGKDANIGASSFSSRKDACTYTYNTAPYLVMYDTDYRYVALSDYNNKHTDYETNTREMIPSM